ncbi:acyl-CoA dehydrogenase family protein [Mycobacterium sp. DL592]|uniref:acyl-CoA dehydrogenase family protein n=1 Tax=Mycobacterium sp. DL592 TaxID=2675524 RepID=UPI00141E2F73|nr:acyl-CoA dehydrogenase family protein [Mycobacterium sp. DL592]
MADQGLRWRERAEAIKDKLAATAAVRDRAGRPPREEIGWLKDAELLGIFIPRQYGGGGASWEQIAAVVGLVAQADASLAHVLLYHYFGGLAGIRGENGFVGSDRARRIAEEQLLHGTVAQAAYPPLIVATQTPDGFRLNGSKPFTTGAALGDVLLAWVVFDSGTTLRGQDVSGQIGTVAVEGGADGLTFGDDWDNLGQRRTASGRTTFTEVAVRTADVISYGIADSARPDQLDVLYMYSGFAAILTGIAVGALSEAGEYIRTTSRPWVESEDLRPEADPLILERYGRLWVDVQSAVTLTAHAVSAVDEARRTGAELTWEERGTAVTLANTARVHASNVALKVSSEVFEIAGARSSSLASGLDRFWRDARTLSLHDPLRNKLVQIGDYALNGVNPEPGFYS